MRWQQRYVKPDSSQDEWRGRGCARLRRGRPARAVQSTPTPRPRLLLHDAATQRGKTLPSAANDAAHADADIHRLP